MNSIYIPPFEMGVGNLDCSSQYISLKIKLFSSVCIKLYNELDRIAI